MKRTSDEKRLVDTNLLVYGLDRASPFHARAAQFFAQVAKGEVAVVVAQQNIIETIQVFVSGYKMSPHEVTLALLGLLDDLGIFTISPKPATYRRFVEMINKAVGSIDVFDWYLAATMFDNGIHAIYTANEKDFVNVPGIAAANPLK